MVGYWRHRQQSLVSTQKPNCASPGSASAWSPSGCCRWRRKYRSLPPECRSRKPSVVSKSVPLHRMRVPDKLGVRLQPVHRGEVLQFDVVRWTKGSVYYSTALTAGPSSLHGKVIFCPALTNAAASSSSAASCKVNNGLFIGTDLSTGSIPIADGWSPFPQCMRRSAWLRILSMALRYERFRQVYCGTGIG